MNVLWMTFGLPFPPDSGVRMRDFYLIREVAKTANVHLFSLVPPGGAETPGVLSSICRSVEIFPFPKPLPGRQLWQAVCGLLAGLPLAASQTYFQAAAERMKAILQRIPIDLLQVEHSLLAAYRQVAGRPFRCRTVLSFHNVGFQQYLQMAAMQQPLASRSLYRLKSAMMKGAEAQYATQYDRCLVVSAQEKERLSHIAPGVCAEVVENGVDCLEKQVLPENGGEPVLLFPGVMDYPPNADAAVYFVRSVLPRIRAQIPGVRFCIAGHSPTAKVRALAGEPGVNVTGWVRDMTPYYQSSAAVVVPLRAGGGTRLKILEAMALGRPVVSTSIGCEGLEVESGRHLLIADEPGRFADSVAELLPDRTRRATLTANARSLVEGRYDWTILGRRLTAIHREVLNGAAK